LPKQFWDWAHIKDKKGRGYDYYLEEEARELYEEWLRMGKPRADNKGMYRPNRGRERGSADLDFLEMFIP